MLIGISGKLNSGKDEVLNMLRFIYKKRGATDFNAYTARKNNYRDLLSVLRFADSIKSTVADAIGCDVSLLEDREFKESPLPPEWWYWQIGDSKIPYNEQEPTYSTEDNLVKLTPRKILQLLGTEGGRKLIHPNLWINSLLAKASFVYLSDLKKIESKSSVEDITREARLMGGQLFSRKYNCPIRYSAVVPDVRFINEIQAVHSKNGVVIRIERPLKERVPKHIWDDFVKHGNKDFLAFIANGNSEYRALFEAYTHASETDLDDYEGFDAVITNDRNIEHLFYETLNVFNNHIKNKFDW